VCGVCLILFVITVEEMCVSGVHLQNENQFCLSLAFWKVSNVVDTDCPMLISAET